MTHPGNIGNVVPAGQDFLIRRLQDLERQVRELASGLSLQAATISSGGISLRDTGAIKIYDAAGDVIGIVGPFTEGSDPRHGVVARSGGSVVANDRLNSIAQVVIGQLPSSLNLADGSSQQGLLLYRDDHTLALSVSDGTPLTGAYQQAFAVWDRTGHTVLADDTTGGVGLANPHLDLGAGVVNTNTATWKATTATSWTGIGAALRERQNPGMTWTLWCQADVGVTGQFRIVVDGTVVATSPTVTGTFANWSATYYWPAGWTFGSVASISLEAEVTAGTGTVRAEFLQLNGAQS